MIYGLLDERLEHNASRLRAACGQCDSDGRDDMREDDLDGGVDRDWGVTEDIR